MTLSRGNWLRTLLTALTVTIAPAGTSTLLAQGFGADPFKPYNSQYNPYTYPMGPASPAGGQGGGMMPRAGNFGANQFQGYLDEMSGAGRQGSERYGIGMPYYRSAVDPSFDPEGKREYRPNQKANRSYEQTRDVITRKYLAYFTEQDPKKRAELLRDYNQSRSRVARAMSGRRESPSRLLEAATGSGVDRRRSAAEDRGGLDQADTAEGNSRRSSRSAARGASSEFGRRRATGSIPPPPPLFGARSNRRTTNPSHRSPSDVLDRSRRLDRGRDVKPGAASRTLRRPLPTSPPPE